MSTFFLFFFGKSDIITYITSAGAQAEWIPCLVSSDAGCKQPEVPTSVPTGVFTVLEMAFRALSESKGQVNKLWN